MPASRYGYRISCDWVANAIADDAQIHWRRYSVYSFIDETGADVTCRQSEDIPVACVHHIPGTLEDVPGKIIKSSFPLDENWSSQGSLIIDVFWVKVFSSWA